MNKQELVKALERTHDEFLEAINQFPEEELSTRPVVGEWTPKDLLAHVTRWENVCSGYLAQIAAGESMPRLEGTSTELNAKWSTEDRKLTLDEVWQNSDASALRVRAMIESLAEGALDRVMRGPWLELLEEMPLHQIIAIDTASHYQQHVKDIGTAKSKT